VGFFDDSFALRVIVVGGRRYRVRSNASDQRLLELVSEVERRAMAVRGLQMVTQEGILLAALVLVAELDEARGRVDRMERVSRDSLLRLVARIDGILGGVSDDQGGICVEGGDMVDDVGGEDGEVVLGEDAV